MNLHHRTDLRVYLHPDEAQHTGCTVLMIRYNWEKKPSLIGKAKVSSKKTGSGGNQRKTKPITQPCGCCGFPWSTGCRAVGEGLAPAGCDAQRVPWFDLVSDTAADTPWACVHVWELPGEAGGSVPFVEPVGLLLARVRSVLLSHWNVPPAV